MPVLSFMYDNPIDTDKKGRENILSPSSFLFALL